MRAILLILFLCTAFICGDAHAQSPSADKPSAETIERGKALMDAGGCAGCHTPDPANPFAGGSIRSI
jgi:mono/diheme cytochrome c family protein